MTILVLGALGRHTNLPVNERPETTFTAARPSADHLISATVSVHIAPSGEIPTFDHFKLPKGVYARVRLMKGETLGFLVGDGEPDGVVSITEAV
ncbi:hypothetical protein KABACHOK_00840 [Brevundimonas phage vB_BpoS-Kabachok]|uniref:Uncharacterized protein n=1 Tax=Brevundimonas phage vB_BpoS-Kabachok TaxID=2948600 RepID=A0A9E7MP13_9CAUD|nr:hypothetical protein KABACHOK_00840 [Brevundimonas phage vB_BpoS-Kabachok]